MSHVGLLDPGQVFEPDQALVEPLLVRVLGGQLRLDLLVVDDPPLGGVDEEHATGLQSGLGDHLVLRDVEHAHLGRHHDEAVVGHPDAGGAQAVAVQYGADHGAVGEREGRRAVPGLHE